jgi:hypothetical protein
MGKAANLALQVLFDMPRRGKNAVLSEPLFQTSFYKFISSLYLRPFRKAHAMNANKFLGCAG